MPDPNSERIGKTIRKHIRIEVELEIHFMIEGDRNKTVYQALTKNISHGGACIMATEGKAQLIALLSNRLPTLNVSMSIGGTDSPTELQTKTAWISSKVRWFMTPALEEMPVLVGLAFKDLRDADAEKIDNYIEDFISKNREPVQEIEAKILTRFRI